MAREEQLIMKAVKKDIKATIEDFRRSGWKEAVDTKLDLGYVRLYTSLSNAAREASSLSIPSVRSMMAGLIHHFS